MKEKKSLKESLKKAIIGLISMLPMLFAIILLLGIFDVYVTQDMITSLFVHNNFIDTIIGTTMGAVLTGNPMVSYILGGELTSAGISLYAVAAFILSWVTLGVVQLPAEVEIFGIRFTTLRTIFTFISTVLVSILTVSIHNWIIS